MTHLSARGRLCEPGLCRVPETGAGQLQRGHFRCDSSSSSRQGQFEARLMVVLVIVLECTAWSLELLTKQTPSFRSTPRDGRRN